jgi:hypothetical protein
MGSGVEFPRHNEGHIQPNQSIKYPKPCNILDDFLSKKYATFYVLINIYFLGKE